MKRSNSNPTSLRKRKSFRSWLKRVTLPNSNQRKVGPDSPKDGVFGIPLTNSIKYAKTTVGYIDDDNVKHSKAGAIPIVVAKCGSFLKKDGLETEGIFRISGSVKRVNELEFVFDQSESNYGLDLNWEGYTVHDVASLLRRYLNKLPEPVIPIEFYQPFRDVMNNNKSKSTEDRIEAFQKLVQSLPPPHQHLLLYLLDTLSLFASAASETKMDIPNLAAIFSPGILRHPAHNTPVQYKISQYVIEFLIEFQSLFTMQLLAPVKHKRSSSSAGVPPLPLLLPSSYPQKVQYNNNPPPLPLHITNPSVPSANNSLTSVDNSPFIESPQDIIAQANSPQQDETQNLGSALDKGIADEDINNASAVADNIHNPTAIDTFTRLASPYYHHARAKFSDYRHTIEPWTAKPAALLVCFSILFVMIAVVVYEAYLVVTLTTFEPLAFFLGLAFYWGMLYTSLSSASADSIVTPVESENKNEVLQSYDEKSSIQSRTSQEEAIPTQAFEQEEGISGPSDTVDIATDEEMLNDEAVMLQWGDLVNRIWKTDDTSGLGLSQKSSSGGDDLSVMSKSSRFSEEENLDPSASISSSDDEEFEFDNNALEQYLHQYEQIKKDEELAKKLQIEEQKARDVNNPFMAEKTNGIEQKVPRKHNVPSSLSINTINDERRMEDGDLVKTPTSL